MRVVWVLLAAAAATALAAPQTVSFKERVAMSVENARNSLLEELLLTLINELRDVILNGSGDIPPLDPLHVDQISLDDQDIPIPGAQVDLSGVTVSNLGSFVIDDLSVTLTSILLQRYRIEVEGRIPSLDIDAEKYDINLSASGFSFFGAGDAKIKVINPALKIDLLVGLRISITQGIFINLLDTLVQFNLEAFEPEITGLFNDEGASAFVNEFLRDFVPSVVQAYEPEITTFLSETIHEIASEILADLDLGSILG